MLKSTSMLAVTFSMLQVLAATTAHADMDAAKSLATAQQVFEATWDAGYSANYCGQNIGGLVNNLKLMGVPLQDSRVLIITNDGPSLFGLINAERTRTNHPDKTDESNWFHHVILVHEGHVFDFDFMGKPTVLPVAEYFNQQFLDEINPPQVASDLVGLKYKLDYKVEGHLAKSFDPAHPLAVQFTRLGKYLGIKTP